MICAKCETQNRGTLKTDGVSLWVQRICGTGKNSPILKACNINAEGKATPAMGVTDIQNVKKGTATVEYAQSCTEGCVKVPISRTYGDPPDLTATITMNLRCADYSYQELMNGKLNLYFEVNCCCGERATDFSQVSEYFVMRGADLSIGYSISNMTVLDGDPQNVQLSFGSVGFDDWQHMQKLSANRIVTSGDAIVSAIQLRTPAGCDGNTSDCKNNQWAMIDNDGTLTIYGEDGTETTPAVPGLTPGDRFFLNQIGNQLYITYSGATSGYLTVTIDKFCVPLGDWVNNPLPDTATVYGTQVIGSTLYVNGVGTDQQAIWTVNGAIVDDIFTSVTGHIRDLSVCGNTKLASGLNGGIYKSGSCVNSFELIPSPTASGANLIANDLINGDVLYAIDTDGLVHCTIDCGEDWDPVDVTIPAGFSADVNFYDANIGYITAPGVVWQTGTGGQAWSNSFLEQKPNFTPVHVQPDCTDPNCVLMVGSESGQGVAYLYKPESC